MSRFTMYDRAEMARQSAEERQLFKDEWIRNKADQLATSFPECAMDFYPTHRGFHPYLVGLDSDEAQDAYAAFVESVCLAKAKKLYSEAEFMGEVA
ncbi:hypothetical protein ACQK5W_04060 [Pantoea sp. FN060301]|uniref:hypothetical protein n=1 Tax=Pantoea sp. FN060301 TaxID=3420380 RepID=UPI003D164D2B